MEENNQTDPYAEQKIREQLGLNSDENPQNYFRRPLENLKSRDFVDLSVDRKAEVKEHLEDLVLNPFLGLARRMEGTIESVAGKQAVYASQHDKDMISMSISRLESDMLGVKEGMNEVLVGLTLADMVLEETTSKKWLWALTYWVMYYSGMDSLSAIRERTSALSMSDQARFYNGVKADWLFEELGKINRPDKSFSQQEILETAPLSREGESLMQRFTRYTADASHWNQLLAEMNTYNPTLGENPPNISETTTEMLTSLFKKIPRRAEDGSVEGSNNSFPFKGHTEKIYIYLDDKGEQIPQDKENKPVRPETKKVPVNIETLDYYNKANSEVNRRWVISLISSLCIHNTKEKLDNLPPNVLDMNKATDEDRKTYGDLYNQVLKTAKDIMKNYDVWRKGTVEYKIAKAAFYMSYAEAFGEFTIADWGWSYSWKKKKIDNDNFVWEGVGDQGDPTGSGDAFTAANPRVHEVAYAGEKNRSSANNVGASMPVDPLEARNYINILLSEAKEKSERQKMIDKIRSGEQSHLARMFGILGVFSPTTDEVKEAGSNSKHHLHEFVKSWLEGESYRKKVGKEVNPNLKTLIEDTVVFIKTPFDGLYYPMLTPQFEIGLLDMLSVGEQYTVADMLKKTWKRGEDGVLVETSFENGGRRLTKRDINWMQFAPNSEDGRAVNNNFMGQVYSYIYGPMNPKILESITKDPASAMTGIVKAVDIGARTFYKKLSNGDWLKDQRPGLEILYATSIVFEYVAFGKYNVLGQGGVQRMSDMLKLLTTTEKSVGAAITLPEVLRKIDDFLPRKKDYVNYNESFYLTLMALCEAIKPIVVATEKMGGDTYKSIEKNKPFYGEKGWSAPYQNQS